MEEWPASVFVDGQEFFKRYAGRERPKADSAPDRYESVDGSVLTPDEAVQRADSSSDEGAAGSSLPSLFQLKPRAAKRTAAEEQVYPAKPRQGDLPHICRFPGLKVYSRTVRKDDRAGRKNVIVDYNHVKWGAYAAGHAYGESKLRRLYNMRYQPPYPEFAMSFDPSLCFCK